MDCYACIWQTKLILHYKLPLIYIRFLSRDLGNYSGNQAQKRAQQIISSLRFNLY